MNDSVHHSLRQRLYATYWWFSVIFIYPKQAKTSTKTQSAQYPGSIIVEKNTINIFFFFQNHTVPS